MTRALALALLLAACTPEARIVERSVGVPALRDWPEQQDAAAEIRACRAATDDVDAILKSMARFITARDQARALERVK